MRTSNRQLAKAAGEKTYQGRPCKHCHGTLKYTGAGSCVICKAANNKKWNQENPEKRAVHDKKYYQNNKDKTALTFKNWYQGNKDKVSNNSLKYRAIKNSPINKMLSELFKVEIQALYAKAQQLTRDTGIEHHVHHYIPLSRGGTNSISNLYAIPKELNLKIGSKDPNNLTNSEDIKLRDQILNYACN